MTNILSPPRGTAHGESRRLLLILAVIAGIAAIGLIAATPLPATASQYFTCADKVSQTSRNGYQYGEIQTCVTTRTAIDSSAIATVKVSLRELQYKTRTGWWKYNYYQANGRVNIVLQRKPTKVEKAPRTVDAHILAVTTTGRSQDVIAEFPRLCEGEYVVHVGVDIKDMRWSGDEGSYILSEPMSVEFRVDRPPPPPM